MKMTDIARLLDCEVLCCEDQLGGHVYSACGSDMMSDVLAFVKDQGVLLTGLLNSQVIRTANMMDMVCIVIVRNKVPTEEMIELASDTGLVLMRSPLRAYEASGVLYYAGLGRREEDG